MDQQQLDDEISIFYSNRHGEEEELRRYRGTQRVENKQYGSHRNPLELQHNSQPARISIPKIRYTNEYEVSGVGHVDRINSCHSEAYIESTTNTPQLYGWDDRAYRERGKPSRFTVRTQRSFDVEQHSIMSEIIADKNFQANNDLGSMTLTLESALESGKKKNSSKYGARNVIFPSVIVFGISAIAVIVFVILWTFKNEPIEEIVQIEKNDNVVQDRDVELTVKLLDIKSLQASLTTEPTKSPVTKVLSVAFSAHSVKDFFPSTSPTEKHSERPSIVASGIPSVDESANPTIISHLYSEVMPIMFSYRASFPPSLNQRLKQSSMPTILPTWESSEIPSYGQSIIPTEFLSLYPTASPSHIPSPDPTIMNSSVPSLSISASPSKAPSFYPSSNPTIRPTLTPTARPTSTPTRHPSVQPTLLASNAPTSLSSLLPTESLRPSNTAYPSASPTRARISRFVVTGDRFSRDLTPNGASTGFISNFINMANNARFPRTLLSLGEDEELDFLVHLGDSNDPAETFCSLDSYKFFSQLLIDYSPVPVLATLGQRDVLYCPNKLEGLQFWKQFFVGIEKNWPRIPFQVRRMVEDESNFSFLNRDILFVGLDLVGQLVGMYEDNKNNNKENNGKIAFDQALGWIEEQVLLNFSLFDAMVIFTNRNEDNNSDALFFLDVMVDRLIQVLKVPTLFVYGKNRRWSVDLSKRSKFLWVVSAETGNYPFMKIEINPDDLDNPFVFSQ